ncbi:short transient receptor potential channel 4-like [Clavelina lepadiformis]|uniref:short transient receptor potential channel 4-like n=1 Tax=Clavelina lepadiformis TaxID=159417 RepID=UPI0040415CD1
MMSDFSASNTDTFTADSFAVIVESAKQNVTCGNRDDVIPRIAATRSKEPTERKTSNNETETPVVETSARALKRSRHPGAFTRSYSRVSPSSSSTSLSSVSGFADDITITSLPSAEQLHYDEAVTGDEREYFSMKTLSEIVSADILQEVKRKLTSIEGGNVKGLKNKVQLSPALEWEQRRRKKQQKNKLCQDSVAKSEIKAGWKVRRDLANLKRSGSRSVNSYYLEKVASGDVRDVKALFSLSKIDKSIKFQPNSLNQHEKTALRIAIENEDVEMCQALLVHEVKVGDCLLHAINRDFLAGVEVILKHESSEKVEVDCENPNFNVGTTPMILAAIKNNYDALKMLHRYGHRLTESISWCEGIHTAYWESANKRKMMCKAKASPAYITLMCEVNHQNPMTFCVKQIKTLQKNADREKENSDFYHKLEAQVEKYMCSLLDQIQSSKELATLFEYDHVCFDDARSAIKALANEPTSRKVVSARLELLERASKLRLVNFVTHPHSQLALSYIRYRYFSALYFMFFLIEDICCFIVLLLHIQVEGKQLSNAQDQERYLN